MKTFKTFAIIGLLTIIFSCGKESSTCTDIEDGVAFEFKQGDSFCLNDILEITITQVVDANCPCDVTCVWAGEFIFELDIINEAGETIQYKHHSESIVTQPEPFPTGLTLSTAICTNCGSCDDPTAIPDMIFEMTVN